MFERRLTDEQYDELAQFWHEYMVLGPRRDEMGFGLDEIAESFEQWFAADNEEPYYSVPEILAFFAEKKWREGTSVANDY